MPLFDAILAVFIQAIWGLNSVAIKVGVQELSPIGLILLRFAISTLILLPFLRSVPKHQRAPLVRLGILFYTGHYVCSFTALQTLDVGTSIVILQAQVFFSMAVAAFVEKERVTLLQIGGALVALCGMAVIFGLPKLAGHFTGIALALMAALAYAVSTLDMKRLKGVGFAAYNAVPMMVALPFLTLLLFTTQTDPIERYMHADYTRAGIALAYQVGLAMLAQFLWQRLIVRYGIAAVSPWQMLMPLFGIAGGVLFLGETLSTPQIIGSALVLSGVGIAQFASRARIFK